MSYERGIFVMQFKETNFPSSLTVTIDNFKIEGFFFSKITILRDIKCYAIFSRALVAEAQFEICPAFVSLPCYTVALKCCSVHLSLFESHNSSSESLSYILWFFKIKFLYDPSLLGSREKSMSSVVSLYTPADWADILRILACRLCSSVILLETQTVLTMQNILWC